MQIGVRRVKIGAVSEVEAEVVVVVQEVEEAHSVLEGELAFRGRVLPLE